LSDEKKKGKKLEKGK